jgi:hypothetical protein
MTKEQREDLYIEWSLYEPRRQMKNIAECFVNDGAYCQENWLTYLRDKLEIEGYWKAVGLM